MGVKTRRVFVRVTEEQHRYISEKAASYGVTLSRLILTAAEAYIRTFDDDPTDASLVAVNYGVWTRVDSSLAGIEGDLSEAKRQLAGVRTELSRANRAGSISADGYRTVFGVLKECRDDVCKMSDELTRCTSLIDLACEQGHIADPYLGPMEADILDEDDVEAEEGGE